MLKELKLKTLNWVLLGAFLLMLSVMLGAFGAHALAGYLSFQQQSVWEKGIHYMMIHALGVLVVAGLISSFPEQLTTWQKAGWSFVVGISLFSGSLFIWASTQIYFVVFLTPIGGMAFLLGWGFILFGGYQAKKSIVSHEAND